MLLSYFLISILSLAAPASDSPICNDLSRLACAPGEYNDGTGIVKSQIQVLEQLQKYAVRSTDSLKKDWEKAIEKNKEFRSQAIKATGLDLSPYCQSEINEDFKACNQSLVEGLVLITQKQTFGALGDVRIGRLGNLRDQKVILESEIYKSIEKDLDEKTQKDLDNSALKKKIQDKIFPQIKAQIIAKLRQLPIEEEVRNKMIFKINSITYNTATDCGDSTGLSKYLVANAFYSPTRNNFRICDGYLFQSDSEFQLATTIAHELSHSIDPCNIQTGITSSKNPEAYPLPSLISCLRSEKSVKAISKKKKARSSKAKEKPYCENDQITESFCDWMSADIVPEYIQNNHTHLTQTQYQLGYANARRPLCKIASPPNGFQVHPEISNRIDALISVQPKVRSQMGCKDPHSKYSYCDANSPASSAKPKEETTKEGVK